MSNFIQRAFTLLEFLIVLAILTVLAGIVIFSLRPAEVFEDTKDSRREADNFSIESALGSFILEQEKYPDSLVNLESGLYDICKQGNTNCTPNSVNLDELVATGYMSEIPVDPDCETGTDTCYDLYYDDEFNQFEIIYTDEDPDFALLPITLPSTIQSDNLNRINGLIDNNDFSAPTVGIGDINNDGFDDIAVSAELNDTNFTDAGAIYVYYGNSTQPDITDSSQADVVIYGNYSGGRFGTSVTDLGDFNGDGIDDFAVSAPLAVNTSGHVYVFYGSTSLSSVMQSTDADILFTGKDAQDNIGFQLSYVGDMNKDGYNDILIGATADEHPTRPASSGRVYLVYGGSSYGSSYTETVDNDAAAVFNGIDYYGKLGISLSTANDLNNDTYPDIIIGAQKNSTDTGSFRGGVFIFYGRSNFSGDYFAESADVIIDGVIDDEYFGRQISTAGDFNDDGQDDILIGSYYYSSNRGRAFVFWGDQLTSSMNANDANVIIDGETSTAHFGYKVAGVGDVDKDGIDDILISSLFISANGKVYLFYGSTTAYATDITLNAADADVIFMGGAEYSIFGTDIDSIGDFNGDEYIDLVFGDGLADVGGSNRGQASLYLSNP